MKYLPFLFIFLISFSCKKYDGLEVNGLDPEYAIAIGQGVLSLEDIISGISDSSSILIDQNDLVHLNYKGTIQSFRGSDIADFINQWAGPIVFFDTLVALPFTTPNGIDLDYAILSNGGALFGYISEFPEPFSVEITIENIITPQGEPYVFFNEHEGPVNFLSDTVLFKDHLLVPTNDSFFVSYKFYKKNSMEFDIPSFIGATIFDFEASYVEGFLGQETFNVDRDTIDIDFFKETITGEVFIEDPKVNVVINNSFGFPIRSSGSVFNFFLENGSILELESSALETINVDYPTLNEVGEIKTTEFPFDNSNSNLTELILKRPIALEYEFIANANPDLDTTVRGFLLDTSIFEIQVAVDLPLRGWARDFIANDTIDIDLEDRDEEFQKAELKVIVENNLPLSVEVQGYFLNNQNIALDSIFQTPTTLVSRDESDPPGEATESVTFIPLTREKLNHIFDTDKLALIAVFNTSGMPEEVVEIFNADKVNIKIGLKVTPEN